MFGKLVKRFADGNLIVQILIGIALGAVIGFWTHYQAAPYNELITKGVSDAAQLAAAKKDLTDLANSVATSIAVLGNLFVGALKAIAPILVFVLVATSIIVKEFGHAKGMQKIVALYLVGTFLAAVVAVVASFLFPMELVLKGIESANMSAPQGIVDVLKDLIFKMVQNPISAISSGNYIGIITWAVGGGIAMRFCTPETKKVFQDVSDGVTKIVRFIIRLAPFGIFGLVTLAIHETGFDALAGYLKLIFVLVGSMAFVTFVVYPAMVFAITKKNPYPLVMTCVRESAVTAFFTRSSAANIPVNMALCKKLGLKEELYSISIPLGATINMAGAAVVIAILALAAAHTLGVRPDFWTALLLCVVSAVGACGASGVPGGSLMLIPLACSLFNISNDIAMQVVAIGFIIGVIQDSVETAINSSTDVIFTAIASQSMQK